MLDVGRVNGATEEEECPEKGERIERLSTEDCRGGDGWLKKGMSHMGHSPKT